MRVLLLFLLLSAPFLYGQTINSGAIYIKFKPNLEIRNIEELSYIEGFDALKSQYNFTVSKGLALSDEKIEALSKQTHSIKNIFKIKLVSVAENLDALVNALKAIPHVVYCYQSTALVEPPNDIPPVTPNFEIEQGYIDGNPGVNMRYAWNQGIIGAGINVRNVEYGLNVDHEDLSNQPVSIEPGVTIHENTPDFYQDHGTAVGGIVCANQGDYGITGLAYGAASFVLYPEWTQAYGQDRVRAVSSAIGDSEAGDVVIFEFQTANFEPGELEPVIWDLTKAATDMGIVIVAASGNGGLNLDGVVYQEYRDRGDSGAIIVGAGTPDVEHRPIGSQNYPSLGNYGARVNVQGWGSHVFTTGAYPTNDIIVNNDENQTYHSNFSGTSAATAVVAGCVIVLQGYYYALTGEYLSSVELRQLLVETGTPQGAGVHIGPLPNMKAAIIELQTMLSVQKPNEILSYVGPNPTSDFLNVQLQNSKNGTTTISLYNAIGKNVFSKVIKKDSLRININNYQSGIYFLHIISGHHYDVKKVVIR